MINEGNDNHPNEPERVEINSNNQKPAPPMKRVDLHSEAPLPPLKPIWKSNVSLIDQSFSTKLVQQDTGESIRMSVESPNGRVWVEGNSLFCACPGCAAPVSVRMWLLTADCWQCDTRIQLTREQEQAIASLLKDQAAPHVNQSVQSPTKPRPVRPDPIANPPPEKSPLPLSASPSGGRRRRTAGQLSAAERMRRMRDQRSAVASVREAFRMTPAWLISFLLHLILIIILLMLYFPNLLDKIDRGITLSTAVDVADQEGAEVQIEDPKREVDFEAPLPRDADLSNQEVRETLQRADQDARELRVDDDPLAPLPDIRDIKKSLTQRQGQSSRFVARDPRMRLEILKKEGGTSLTEAAVARGLRWLAKVQNQDGSWSLRDYKYHYRKNNKGDMAATALALLPFLGAGQTHEYGKYKSTVARGLRWMMDHQDQKSGDLRNRLTNNSAMYAHGQAAIVLVEAYALSGDEQFRQPAQSAIDFIVGAQRANGSRSSRGGWRYSPGQSGDTSVFGWQMMALQSALSPQLGLDVPRKSLLFAADYLDAAGNRKQKKYPAGTLYAYQPGNNSTVTMTAEALLCRIYLGWKRDDIRLKIATEYLLEKAPPSYREIGKYNLYYIYYATQLFHHYGGDEWEKWNAKMQPILVNSQQSDGTYAGSWPPEKFRWGDSGQRIYTTALAICTLEVYYRHLPLFKQIDIDSETAGDQE